jgi:hypothetical protein
MGDQEQTKHIKKNIYFFYQAALKVQQPARSMAKERKLTLILEWFEHSLVNTKNLWPLYLGVIRTRIVEHQKF